MASNQVAGKQSGVERAFARAREGQPVRRHKGTTRVRACASSQLPEGGVFIVVLERFSVGIFRIDGAVYALRNECPHNGAEICRGHVSAVYPPTAQSYSLSTPELDRRVLSCPLHGRQYDIVTGQAMFEEHGSVLTYTAWEEDGTVYIEV